MNSKICLVGSEAKGCQIDHLSISDGKVSFDRLDEALPFPIDERAQAALNIAPVLDDLDRYDLMISGLPSGQFEVSIDGDVVAQADAETLSKGLNLANTAGSISKQARKVLALVFKKNDLFFKRWRDVQLFSIRAARTARRSH